MGRVLFSAFLCVPLRRPQRALRLITNPKTFTAEEETEVLQRRAESSKLGILYGGLRDEIMADQVFPALRAQ